VRKHYGIDIDILSPNRELLDPFVKDKGLFSFYEDGHSECCGIRKVEPLRRKLATVDAWITGQRKDQSVDTRQDIPEVQQDSAFSTPSHTLIKFNPLLNWSSAQVWDYIEAYQVPFNPLHQQGFVSIGCEPCTRAILPNQHERVGRWWWEDSTKKECGLHSGNVKM
jgi:phosphoadenosine phosphosulfate reductase